MEDYIKNRVNQKREELCKIAEKYGIEEKKVFVYTCIIYNKVRGNIDNIIEGIEEIFKNVNEIKTAEENFYLNAEDDISESMDRLAKCWAGLSRVQKDALALEVAGSKNLKFQILMDNYGYVEEELSKNMKEAPTDVTIEIYFCKEEGFLLISAQKIDIESSGKELSDIIRLGLVDIYKIMGNEANNTYKIRLKSNQAIRDFMVFIKNYKPMVMSVLPI